VNDFRLTPKHIELYKVMAKNGEGRGCNDLDPDEIKMLTRFEWGQLYQAYHIWNGSEDWEVQSDGWHLMDFMAIAFLRDLITKQCLKSISQSTVHMTWH